MNNTYMYREFNNYLLDKRISKPHKNTRYATQGVTQVNDEIFVTYYDTDKLKNSIVDIIRKDDHITFELDNKSHVGGISYSKDYNSIFVSNNSYVNTYDLNDLRDKKHGDTLILSNKIKVHEEVGIASYLTVFGKNLYVGRFNKDKATKLAIYDLTDEGVKFNKLLDVPFKKIQGMCIYKFEGSLYYIFSSSYGRRSNSYIIVSRLIDGKFKKIKEFAVPSMLEQISVSDKSLMMVFESDCSKYNENIFNSAKEKINNIIYLDIEKLLTNC